MLRGLDARIRGRSSLGFYELPSKVALSRERIVRATPQRNGFNCMCAAARIRLFVVKFEHARFLTASSGLVDVSAASVVPLRHGAPHCNRNVSAALARCGSSTISMLVAVRHFCRRG